MRGRRAWPAIVEELNEPAVGFRSRAISLGKAVIAAPLWISSPCCVFQRLACRHSASAVRSAKASAERFAALRSTKAPAERLAATGPAGAQTLFGTNTNWAVAGNGQTCTLGEIILSAGAVANGTPANGQTLSIAQHTALFSLLGTTYGGDGIQTFQLPDLRAAAPNGLTHSICDLGIFPTIR